MTHTDIAPARTRISLGIAALVLGLASTASAGTAVDEGPRSSYIVVDDEPAPRSAVAAGSRDVARPTVIYLNRNGGTYRPGRDSAGDNTSSILARTATIPKWSVSDGSWNKVVDCVEGLMSRWHVEVTDQDPGDVPHYEVVVGGNPEDAGFDENYAGVAPFSSACRAMPSAVVYTFVETIDSSLRVVCEIAVHEVGHAIGLDHEYLCEDPMSYLHGCGEKSFQAEDAPCGERSPRECLCGGDTQNTVELLNARLGSAGTGNPAPTVQIAQPARGAKVAPGFTVEASAFDDSNVDEVELWVDAQLVDRVDTAPFTFTTNRGLAAGEHTIEVRAIDAGSAVGSETITVTIAPEVSSVESDSDETAPATGLGCAAGGGNGGLATALGVIGLVLARRRARRSTRA